MDINTITPKIIEFLNENVDIKEKKYLILVDISFLLITLISIYCLWKQRKNMLLIILLLLSSYLSVTQEIFSMYYMPIMGIMGYITEFYFAKINDDNDTEDNKLLPLWKVPLWSIIGFYGGKMAIMMAK